MSLFALGLSNRCDVFTILPLRKESLFSPMKSKMLRMAGVVRYLVSRQNIDTFYPQDVLSLVPPVFHLDVLSS